MSYEERLEAYESCLRDKANELIHNFLEKQLKLRTHSFRSAIRATIPDAFVNASADFWSEIEVGVMSEMALALDGFDHAAESFSHLDVFAKSKTELEEELASIYRDSLISETGRSVLTLRAGRVFEKLFRFDSADRPRLWDSNSAIDEVYDEAVKKVSVITVAIAVSPFRPSPL